MMETVSCLIKKKKKNYRKKKQMLTLEILVVLLISHKYHLTVTLYTSNHLLLKNKTRICYISVDSLFTDIPLNDKLVIMTD